MLVPWPLGRLRPVEFGAIHSVAIGVDQSGEDMSENSVDAEALPPASLNRLWESAHPGMTVVAIGGFAGLEATESGLRDGIFLASGGGVGKGFVLRSVEALGCLSARREDKR